MSNSTSHIAIPPEVYHGSQLHDKNIVKNVAANSANLPLPHSEEILYHYYNSSTSRLFVKDETEDCVLLTTLRFIKLEKKKVSECVNRCDIIKVVHTEMGGLKYDKLTISLKGGKEASFGIWAKNVAHFFYSLLDDAIPLTQRIAPRRDHTKAPALVRHGLALDTSGVNNNLRANSSRAPFLPDESLVYHFNNSPNNGNLLLLGAASIAGPQDETADCLLLTNLRFIKIQKKALHVSVRLSQVSRVTYQKGGVGKYDHLHFAMLDGTTESAGVLLTEACLFFLHAIRRRLRERNGKLLEHESATASATALAAPALPRVATTADSKVAAVAAADLKVADTKVRERFDFLPDDTFFIVWPTNPSLVVDVRPSPIDPNHFVFVLAPRTGAKSQQWRYDSSDRLVPVLARHDEKHVPKKAGERFAPAWSRDLKLKESDGQIKATASKEKVVLSVHGVCCGHRDCEVARVAAGSLVELQPSHKDTEYPLQQWVVKTDFESFMDDLVTPVLDKMNTQNERNSDVKGVVAPPEKPFDFDIPPESYGHDCIIHVAGLFSAWRSEVPAGCIRFGDMLRKGYDLPAATTTLARDHPAFVKPISYTLIMKQERGDSKQHFYVWWPNGPSAEYTALGCVFTAHGKEPALDYVRVVPIKYLIKTTSLQQVYADTAAKVSAAAAAAAASATSGSGGATAAAAAAAAGDTKVLSGSAAASAGKGLTASAKNPAIPSRFSVWTVSDLNTCVISYNHLQPTHTYYRFPFRDAERKSTLLEMSRSGRVLLAECIKALSRMLKKAEAGEIKHAAAVEAAKAAAKKKQLDEVRAKQAAAAPPVDAETQAKRDYEALKKKEKAEAAAAAAKEELKQKKKDSDGGDSDEEDEDDDDDAGLNYGRVSELLTACDELHTNATKMSAAQTGLIAALGMTELWSTQRKVVDELMIELGECKKLVQRFIHVEFCKQIPNNPSQVYMESVAARLSEVWDLLDLFPAITWKEQCTWMFRVDELKDAKVREAIETFAKQPPDDFSEKLKEVIFHTMLRLVNSRVTTVITIDVSREAERRSKLAAAGGSTGSSGGSNSGPPPSASSGAGPGASAAPVASAGPLSPPRAADMVKPGLTKPVSASTNKAPSIVETLIEQVSSLMADLPRIRKSSAEKAVVKFFVSQYHAHVNGLMEKLLGIKLTLSDVGKLIKFTVKTYLTDILKPALDATSLAVLTESVRDWLDQFVEIYIQNSKSKMVQWVTNVIESERSGKESLRQDSKQLWFTSAPQTLFLDLNTGLKGMVEQHGIEGKGLVRVGAAFAHLLTFYIDSLHRYYATARFEYHAPAAAGGSPVAAAAGGHNVPPAAPKPRESKMVNGTSPYDFQVQIGTGYKPHTFFLAQICNVEQYQFNTENMKSRFLKLIADEKDDAEIEESYEEVRDKFLELGAHATEVLGHQFAQQLAPAYRVIGTPEWLAAPPPPKGGGSSSSAGAAPSTPFSAVFEPLFDAHMEVLDPLIPKDVWKGKLAVVVQLDVVTEYLKHFARCCVPLSVKNGGGAGFTEHKKWPDAIRAVMADVKYLKGFFKDFPHTPNAVLSAALEPLDTIGGLFDGEEPMIPTHIAKLTKRLVAVNSINCASGTVTPASIVGPLIEARSDLTKDQKKKILSQFAELAAKHVAEQAASVAAKQQQIAGDWYLEIDLVHGRELAVCDSNGKSDPYIVCRLQGMDEKTRQPTMISERKTKPIKETLNPDWNLGWNDFKQPEIIAAQSVLFQCWDWDRWADDDFMGEALVPLDIVRQQMLIAMQDSTPTSASASPSSEPVHPKITMTLPLSVRPGQKKDKAAGAITVKFSLYQKQIKVKDLDEPTPTAAATAAAASTKDHKSTPSGGGGVSGAGFEKLLPAKSAAGKGAGAPGAEPEKEISDESTAQLHSFGGAGAGGDEQFSFDAVLQRGSDKYATKRLAQRAAAAAESRQKEVAADTVAAKKKKAKQNENCKVQ